MPQISSQVTRQAILVGDSSYDPEHPPDKLALFGEDGQILNADTLRGADGVQGPPGIPGINWRGLYTPDADYVINDGVYYNGSSWRALLPMIHPAAEPSEEGALAQLPFFEQLEWPAVPVGTPFEVTIPDDHTAQWRYFDLVTGGDVTFTWDSDAPVYTGPYTNDGASHVPGSTPASPYTVTLPAGRVWIDFQDSATRTDPNNVNMTVTLSNGAVALPSLPWALVARAGADGAPGADGADGSGVPVGGTTGQLLAKVSDADGDVGWEDPPAGGGGSGGGGGWTIAQDDTQVPIPTDGSAIGPELDFTVGDSGLALLHVSMEAFTPSVGHVGISIDGGSNFAEATIDSGVPQWFSLGFADNVADFSSSGGVVIRPGAMLRLAPGDHTVRLVAGASNSGGQARKFRLAAQAL